jgi:hypothetical protein
MKFGVFDHVGHMLIVGWRPSPSFTKVGSNLSYTIRDRARGILNSFSALTRQPKPPRGDLPPARCGLPCHPES